MFEKVLVPTDFSEISENVINLLPGFKKIGLEEVVLIYVINKDRYDHPASGFDVSKFLAEEEEYARQKLSKYVEELEKKGVKASFIDPPPFGDPEAEIVKTAKKINASLIMMGSRGKGWLKEKIFGGVAEAVVRYSTVPVLVFKVIVREHAGEKSFSIDGEEFFKRILVAYDFSEHSEKALEGAINLASKTSGEVIILHVFERHELAISYRRVIEKELKNIVGELRKKGIEAKYVTKTGTPYKEIVRTAMEEDAKSIFIGFRGARGFLETLLMGSTVDAVLRYSHIPVLVVK